MVSDKIGDKVGEFGQQVNFKYFDDKVVWSQNDYAEFMGIMDWLDRSDTIVYGCRNWTHQEFKAYMLIGRKVEKK